MKNDLSFALAHLRQSGLRLALLVVLLLSGCRGARPAPQPTAGLGPNATAPAKTATVPSIQTATVLPGATQQQADATRSAAAGTITPTGCPPPAGWVAYTILPGDTLWALATSTGSTVDQVMQGNCLKDNHLTAYETLHLPKHPPTPVPAVAQVVNQNAGAAAVEPTKPEATASANLSLASLDRVPPDDVLREIYLASAGGHEHPKFSCKSASYPNPKFETEYTTRTVRLMDAPDLSSCGWKNTEPVVVTIRYPDGRTVSHLGEPGKNDSSGHFSLLVSYQIGYNDPVGNYTVTEKSSVDEISTSFSVGPRTGPAVLPIFDDPFYYNPELFYGGQKRVLLYGFAAKQTVRMLLYGGTQDDLSWIGSQQVVTWPDGNLVITNQIPNAIFWVALSQQTEVDQANFEDHGLTTLSTGTLVLCSGAKPSRLKGNGANARVAVTNGQPLELRLRPGFSEAVTGSAPEGSTFQLKNVPICADHSWWWNATITTGAGRITGYAPEADPSGYRLEPTP